MKKTEIAKKLAAAALIGMFATSTLTACETLKQGGANAQKNGCKGKSACKGKSSCKGKDSCAS